MRTVLRALFGRQEAFFAQVQETQARNVVLLLKELKGDDLDIMDMVRTLRDPQMCISSRTVATHLEHIYEKLDVHTKVGLVAMVRASDRVLEAGARFHIPSGLAHIHHPPLIPIKRCLIERRVPFAS